MTSALLSIGSVLTLSLLAILNLIAAWYFYKRLRGGHNGTTLALLLQMLVTALFMTISMGVVVYGAYHSPPEFRTMVQAGLFASRGLLLISTINLVLVARIEARRPLRRQTSTRKKIYSAIDGEE